MKVKRTKFNKTSPEPYYFENELRDSGNAPDKTIYNTVQDYEITTMFEFAGYEPDLKLSFLADQIKVRIKITKQEIFKIGELLFMAKRVCQEEGTSFQSWIDDNFDFSLKTANNFMNVFQNCLGFKTIASEVPISILYKLSAPGYPKELRNYIFNNVDLEKMTNGKIQKLRELYKEGNIEVMEKYIVELNKGKLVYRQSNYTFDMYENAIRTLKNLRDKIVTRGESKFNLLIEYKELVKSQEPKAAEVNLKLFNTLDNAIKALETTLYESRLTLNKYWSDIEEKM